jgi:transposase
MPNGTQTINGIEYVYTYDSKWNSGKKYGTHTRNYIGKMVDGVFVPNKKYILQAELDKIKSNSSASVPRPVKECKRTFYGATYLFDAIGKKLGIVEDLKKCFPGSYEQILSIAYYLILEDRNPLSRFPKWAKTHYHPFDANISSQRSSEILGLISENSKQNFFRLQGKRRLENEYLVYDTTSISSYSRLLKQVRYGNNKEHNHLPQINLALIFGEKSSLPFYYRKLPGNITDVKTLQNILADIDFLQLNKVKLVMDRGFYSEININALYQKHYKFLIATKTSLKFVQANLDKVRDTMTSRSCYSSRYGLNYHTSTINWNYSETKKRGGAVETSEKRMYMHLFYNEQKAVDDKIEFNAILDELEEELKSNKRVAEHEILYARYYDITESPVRGITLTPKQDAINKVKKNYGYFTLLSNEIKNPLDALEIYRSKDLIEKAFGNLKERLNMRRTSVSSEENLEGKFFVQFVALIYLSYIKKAMNDQNLFKRYTIQELLDELDVIEIFEQPDQKRRIGEITKKQMELYKCLGVNMPS